MLGPVEVVDEGRPLALGGGKQRALLAVLVLNANRVVSTDRLIDALWGERTPSGAPHTLQVYVSQLRKALRVEGSPRDAVLATQGPGYVLQVQAEDVDLQRFERMVGEGRRALAAAEPIRAAQLLRDALALWRGSALADLAAESFAQPEIVRLEDLRLSAIEDRVQADLALGSHADVVPELQVLVVEHPLRERLRAQLMLALYRSGRQAEALEVYRDARALLADELGIDPSPELRRLERAILEQDPELEVAPSRERATGATGVRERSRGGLVVAALAAAAVLVGTVTIVILGRGPERRATASLDVNSVGRIDPATGELVGAIPTAGSGPAAMVWFDGSLWVANTTSRTVARIDPATERVVQTVPTEGTPTALAAGDGTLWVLNGFDGAVLAVDPRTNAISDTVVVPAGSGGIAFAAGAVWVTNTLDGTVTGIDPRNRVIVESVRLDGGANPKPIAASGDDVWVGDGSDPAFWRIDAETGRIVASPGLRSVPTAIAVGGGTVWVVSGATDLATRVDPKTGLSTTIEVGDGPAGIIVVDGAVWIADGDGTVSRVDATTSRLVRTIDVGVPLEGIATGSGSVWVSAPA